MTTETEWQEFRDEVIEKELPVAYVEALQVAFYAGSTSMLYRMVHMAQAEHTEADAQAFLTTAQAELQEFSDSMGETTIGAEGIRRSAPN